MGRPGGIVLKGFRHEVKVSGQSELLRPGTPRYLVALMENICGKLSLSFGSRHQPSSPCSITG